MTPAPQDSSTALRHDAIKVRASVRHAATRHAASAQAAASTKVNAPARLPAPARLTAPTLVERIHERIQQRLGGRIQELRVDLLDKRVVLNGRCATYYSKQLAQHAALGVIEDEQLENAIVVSVGR